MIQRACFERVFSPSCVRWERNNQSVPNIAYFVQQIVKHITVVKMAHLWRLAQARRLFLCVLSTAEGAHTTSLREISTGLNTLHMEQLEQGQNILKILERLKEKVERLPVSGALVKGDVEHVYES